MEQAVFENKLIHCWLPETGELPDLLPGQCFPALLSPNLPKHSPSLNSSHHFGPLPAGCHGPAMKCQQMHDDHRHAGGQTSPYPACAQPPSSAPCPGVPTACLLQSNRSSSWHHFGITLCFPREFRSTCPKLENRRP